MKVIMKKTGNIQDVSEGYARNYLLPKGLAVIATKEGVHAVEEQQQKLAYEQQQREAKWQKWASDLPAATVKLTAAANEDGTLFGALPESAILNGLNAQQHIALPPEWIRVPGPIKHVGQFTVDVEFPNRTRTTFHVNLEKQ